MEGLTTPVSTPVATEGQVSGTGVTDPAKVTKPAEPLKPKEDPISSKFAALARKEKIAFQTIEQAKAKEKLLAEREARIKEQESRYQENDKLGKESPLELLKKLGYSYQDITEMHLKQGKPTADHEIRRVREEIETLRKEQADRETKAQEDRKAKEEQDHQAQIQQFKEGVKEFVASKPEDYELIALFGQEELIYSTIEAHYEQKQKILTVKEASDLVEQYLEGELERAKETKKFKAKFLTPKEEPKKAPTSEDGFTEQSARTLNNSMSGSAMPADENLTDDERDRRARAFLDSL